MRAALEDLELALKFHRLNANTWKLRGMLSWNLASVRYKKKLPCLKEFQDSVVGPEEAVSLDLSLDRTLRPMIRESRQAVAENQPR